MSTPRKVVSDPSNSVEVEELNRSIASDTRQHPLPLGQKIIVDPQAMIEEPLLKDSLLVDSGFAAEVSVRPVATVRKLYYMTATYAFPVGSPGTALCYTEVLQDNIVLVYDLRSIDTSIDGPFYYVESTGRLYYKDQANSLHYTHDGLTSTLVNSAVGLDWSGIDVGGGSLWALADTALWEFPLGSGFPVTGTQRVSSTNLANIPRYDSSIDSVLYVKNQFLHGVYIYTRATDSTALVRPDENVLAVYPNPELSRIIFSENPGGVGVVQVMSYAGGTPTTIHDPSSGVSDPEAVVWDNANSALYFYRGGFLQRATAFGSANSIDTLPALSGLHWGD